MDLVTYALVTLDNCKTFLGITNDSQNELLKFLINMATDYIESETGIRFKSTAYANEEYDGTGTRELKLKHFPVTAFTKLEVNNASDNTDSWETIDSKNYWVDNDTGIITRTSAFADFDDDDPKGLSDDTVFSTGKNKYRASYTAGYATVPYDIQMACLGMVADAKNRMPNSGVVRETLGDHSIEMASVDKENKLVSNILDKYRDIPLCS